MRKNEKGFGAVEILVIIVVILLIVAAGWLFFDRQKTSNSEAVNNTQQEKTTEQQPSEKKDELKSYIIDNEGLMFDYNSKLSAVKQVSAEKSEDSGLYVVKTEVTTGAVVLLITTGISNIGGGPACTNDGRGTCKIVDTKTSTYLGKPVTYRLVEAKQVQNCGYAGVPLCDQAPLTTSYLIDTSTSNEFAGPCCGTVSSEAKNLGKKAEYAGKVLVNIVPSQAVASANLFKNSDLLETIKIIETLRYEQ